MLYCTDLLQVCVSHSKEECHTTYEEVCKPVYHKPTYQTAAHNGKECEQVPKKECKYVQVNNNNDSTGHMTTLLSSSASKSSIRRFVITKKAPTRAFSWVESGRLLPLSHLRHY